MRIDRRLNIVIPIYADDESNKIAFYIHSTPIGREVFETYFLVISKTFAEIYNQGLGITAGPRVASLLLKKVASDIGVLDGVQSGLMAEIRRLTNVVMPSANGWETIPFQDVLTRKLIGEDDVAEVENALVFFTVASSVHHRTELSAILNGASKLWGAQISSSSCTEFQASLKTSIEAVSSGVTAIMSSVPS